MLVHDQATERGVVAGTTESPETRPRVLLIDDDVAVSRSLGRVLARAVEVEIVESAEEAEALLLAGAVYELIVCDLMLKGKNGVEFYLDLRATGSRMAARVVFLSGYGEDPEIARDCREVPCLAKPIQVSRIHDLAKSPTLSASKQSDTRATG